MENTILVYKKWLMHLLCHTETKDLHLATIKRVNKLAKQRVSDEIELELRINTNVSLKNGEYDIPKMQILYTNVRNGDAKAVMTRFHNQWEIRETGGLALYDLRDIQHVLDGIQAEYDLAYDQFVQYYIQNYYHIITHEQFAQRCWMLVRGGVKIVEWNLQQLHACMDNIFLSTVPNYQSYTLWSDPVDAETFNPMEDWLPLHITKVVCADHIYKPRMVNYNDVFTYTCDEPHIARLCYTLTNTFELIRRMFIGEMNESSFDYLPDAQGIW